MDKIPTWKKGRGKLGVLHPLTGSWQATADSARGKYRCTKTFRSVLDGKYIELETIWYFAAHCYEEKAMYGLTDGQLSFWSFTSDGKNSRGFLSAAPEIHPDAICFEAKMPAGTARMIYWPGKNQTLHWAVESKTTKGWKRFTEHHYFPVKP